jgi:hypothetical protein
MVRFVPTIFLCAISLATAAQQPVISGQKSRGHIYVTAIDHGSRDLTGGVAARCDTPPAQSSRRQAYGQDKV